MIVSVESRWTSLQNSLGGLFCSSISPKKSTGWRGITYPTLTYPPQSNFHRSSNSTNNHFRLSLLPSERLCTENLTPFLKLLPCNSRAGLAQLLNPHALVSADWHGIKVYVTKSEGGAKLEMRVRSVFDPVRIRDYGKAGASFRRLFHIVHC